MTNTPWEAASPRYKKFVFIALVLMGGGIIMAMVGINLPSRPLLFIAIAVMGIGMCVHIASLVVRARDARAWRIANGYQQPRKKK